MVFFVISIYKYHGECDDNLKCHESCKVDCLVQNYGTIAVAMAMVTKSVGAHFHGD